MAVIGSLMKTDMTTAAPGETVAHAAYSMASNGVGAVLVIEAGKLVGFLSERDVLKRVVAEGLDPAGTRVADVATADPLTVDTATPVRECSELIREKGVRHLPVLQDGAPVGIISSRDLFGYVVESLERVIDDEQYARALAIGDDPYDHLGGSYGR
jgi:CBS domain-containing protein